MALAQNGHLSFERSRAELSGRLRERRGEIESAVLTRALAVSEGGGEGQKQDPEYLEGLRGAIVAAVDYGLATIESGEERAPAPPPALLTQARLAARHEVGLDTVLRRYSAGYILLTDFLLEEAERCGIRGGALKRLLHAQAALDQLLAAVGQAYAQEAKARPATSEERRAERVERLLAGEPIDASALGYELEANHIGAIASGEGATEALRPLAAELDARLLSLPRPDGSHWAWLGSRRGLDPDELQQKAKGLLAPGLTLAIGEPGEGIAGWRLSHRQAKAAHSVAQRGGEPLTRYAEVALLAAVLADELLATSLRQLYLEPLEAERDGGKTALETLRAYFAAGCNVSSAAAALGVRRHTVTSRLRTIEDRIGHTLRVRAAEIELTLSLSACTPD